VLLPGPAGGDGDVQFAIADYAQPAAPHALRVTSALSNHVAMNGQLTPSQQSYTSESSFTNTNSNNYQQPAYTNMQSAYTAPYNNTLQQTPYSNNQQAASYTAQQSAVCRTPNQRVYPPMATSAMTAALMNAQTSAPRNPPVGTSSSTRRHAAAASQRK
jgi:hypothetical protein